MANEKPMEKPNLDELTGAIRALADEGGADALRVVCLIDRLLQDDWTGCGVYEALEEALDKAQKNTVEGDIDTAIL
jgi:hypothetical protein